MRYISIDNLPSILNQYNPINRTFFFKKYVLYIVQVYSRSLLCAQSSLQGLSYPSRVPERTFSIPHRSGIVEHKVPSFKKGIGQSWLPFADIVAVHGKKRAFMLIYNNSLD